MNGGIKDIESTETRKKRRRSGFRFSSRKVLERSRVKREIAKVGGYQFNSVTKTLTFPSEICDIVHKGSAAGSSHPPCLDSVLEHNGAGIDLSFGNAFMIEEFNQEVSYSNSPLIV